MSCKYALLAFPNIGEFPELTQDHDLGFSTLIIKDPTSLLSTIPAYPWKDWLGSLTWEDLFEAKNIVITYCPTSTPEILDGENKALSSHISGAVYKALLLVAPFCGTGGKIHLLSGKGHITGSKIHIDDIRSYSTIDQWVMPGFRYHNNYWSWMNQNLTETGTIAEWKDLIAKLHPLHSGPSTYLFRLSLEIFRLGLNETWADIMFPHIVRSIETLNALPKLTTLRKTYGSQHTTAKEFAARILKYYPVSNNHLYQLSRIQLYSLFEDIYQLRSDSVHGKPLAWTLRQAAPNLPDDDLQKLEYVSKTAARSLLRSALSNPEWMSASVDRTALEQAWLNGTI